MAVSATSMAKNRIRVFKIVVLGDGGVGKSGTLIEHKKRTQTLNENDEGCIIICSNIYFVCTEYAFSSVKSSVGQSYQFTLVVSAYLFLL